MNIQLTLLCVFDLTDIFFSKYTKRYNKQTHWLWNTNKMLLKSCMNVKSSINCISPKYLWNFFFFFFVVPCHSIVVHRTHRLTQRDLPTYIEFEKLMSTFKKILIIIYFHCWCFSLLVLRNSLPSRAHISSGRIAPVCLFCFWQTQVENPCQWMYLVRLFASPPVHLCGMLCS